MTFLYVVTKNVRFRTQLSFALVNELDKHQYLLSNVVRVLKTEIASQNANYRRLKCFFSVQDSEILQFIVFYAEDTYYGHSKCVTSLMLTE